MNATPSERRRPPARAGGEAEGVRGEDLSRVLKEWKKRWYNGHPKIAGSENDEDTGHKWYGKDRLGHIQYLKAWTGYNDRRLWGFVEGEYRFVSISIAWELLELIDREYCLYNGECPIIPNPRWSQERWVKYMRERGCERERSDETDQV